VTILAVTGMLREANIVKRAGVMAIACGGDFAELRTALRDIGEIDGVISIGIAGGLAPGLKPGSCVLATEVVDDPDRFDTDDAWREAMRAKLPHAMLEPIAGTNVILATPKAKESNRRMTGAAAADMESHIAARFAKERKIPFAALRVIADPAESVLPQAARNALSTDGSIDYGAVLRSVLQNPGQIPALMRTARESEIAFAELLRCVRTLGDRLAAPDFG
jgi:adenosylhomocysteine nucleosidase